MTGTTTSTTSGPAAAPEPSATSGSAGQNPQSGNRRNYGPLIKGIICVAVGAAIYVIPPQPGLSAQGIHMLGIFVGTILGLILRPLPTAAVAIVGLTVGMVTGTMSAEKVAFSGLGSASIWLIVAAFFIAQGFASTGLGRRIALMFISLLGKSSLGISYGLSAADLVLAPATPSNTARLGGILFPIITSISDVQGSSPRSDESRKRIGAYLCVTANNVNGITSAMFVTSMAGGPVVASLAKSANITLSWGTWALANIVPGLVCLLIIRALIHKIFPPTITRVSGAREDAKAKLKQLGRLSGREWIMLVTFIAMLVLWALGAVIDINATVVAFLGVSVLLCTNIITWKDMAANQSAWSTLVFFGVLVGMATPLNSLGVIKWAGQYITQAVHGLSWPVVLVMQRSTLG